MFFFLLRSSFVFVVGCLVTEAVTAQLCFSRDIFVVLQGYIMVVFEVLQKVAIWCTHILFDSLKKKNLSCHPIYSIFTLSVKADVLFTCVKSASGHQQEPINRTVVVYAAHKHNSHHVLVTLGIWEGVTQRGQGGLNQT